MKQDSHSKKGVLSGATIVVVLMSLVVAAGCGSSGEGAGVAVQPGTLSRAEFTKKADGICTAMRAKFDREYEAILRKFQKEEPSQAQLEAEVDSVIVGMLVPIFEGAVDEIAALGAPKGDEGEVAAFLSALRQRLDEVEATPKKVSNTLTPFAKAEKLAEADDLKGCAESFS